MGWFRSVCLGIDQLMNAILGGNPDSSISARIGYHAVNCPTKYWLVLQKVVDVTFYPLDGMKHCYLAYKADTEDYYLDDMDELEKAALMIVTIVSCILLAIPIYLLALFNRIFSN